MNTYTCDEAVELTGHGRYNYYLLIVCSLITCACSLDMFGYAAVVAAASCDLHLDFQQLGILASAPFAGVLFAFPWGYFADTHGRKGAILISTSVGCVFAVISAFSTHWLFMLAVKIIGSSFTNASFFLTMALVGESTGSKWKSQFLFIMNSCSLTCELVSFGLAWFILPLKFNIPLPFLNIFFRPWRLFTIVLAIPLGIGACLMFYLYESPKFLASNGQHGKALDVMKRIYERNGGKREEYPVKSIMQNAETKTKKLSLVETIKQQTLPIFKPPLLWRTIQLFFLSALCGATNNTFFMFYPTMVNLFFQSLDTRDSSDQTFCQRMFGEANSTSDTISSCNDELSLNTIYSGMAYGLFFMVASMTIVKAASRPRLLMIAVLLVSGVSLLLVNLKNHIANIIFFTVLQITSLGLGCTSSYFINLYPTTQRGQVTSLGLMVTRLCSMICVSLIGSIIPKHCESTFYIWSVLVFGGVVVCLFLPPDRKTKTSPVDSQSNLNSSYTTVSKL